MGEHKGWFICPDPDSGRIRGFVRIPSRRTYKTKTHDTPAAARAWAIAEAAKIVRGDAVETGARVADLRKLYLEGLAARGRSKSHLANVTRTIDALARIAPDLASAKAPAAIEAWLDSLSVSATTRNRMLVEVRALVRWAIKRDRLVKDPTRAIERSQASGSLRALFSIDEVYRLLAMPTPMPDVHRRLALMLLAGLRSDEAAALQWADVDLAGDVILIRARAGFRLKRGKERIVPLQPLLRSILGPAGAPEDAVAPLSDSNIRRLFPRFLAACEVPISGRSAHSCRHAYAGLMTATGVPGPLLSAYLGHTSVGTTMIYTRLAARYAQAVSSWPMGVIRLWDGVEAAEVAA